MNNWPKKSLAELVVPTEQRNPKRSTSSEFLYVDIASVNNSTKEIIDPKVIRGGDAPSRARKIIRKGDIIVSTVRPNLNAVAIVPESLDGQICSTGFSVLRPSNQITSGYLFAFVRSPLFIDYLIARTTGANYPAVSDETVKSAHIPVPPLAEQERMVTMLDKADELRKLREKADARMADLIPALFHEMFGDPLGIIRNGALVRVEDVGRIQLGRQRAPKYQTGLHTRPYVRVANVFEDRIDVSDLLAMDFNESDFLQYRLEHGDILLNEGQSTELVGRPAMWRNEVSDCCFQNTLVRFQCDKSKVLPEYSLAVFLNYFRRGAFANISSKTSNVAHLGAARFAKMPFLLPEMSLQAEFEKQVSAVRAIQSKQCSTRLLVDDLFQSILHRAFTGKL